MYKVVAIILAVVSGLLALVDYFVSDPRVDALGAGLAQGVIILAAFGLLAGVLNLLAAHTRRAATRGPERPYSATLAIGLLGTLAVGVGWQGSVSERWVFDYVYYPLQATIGGLLAFYIVSAAWRAFRVRTVDAAILLGSSLLALVAQLPFVATIAPALGRVSAWLMAVPATAGARGMLLGIALGTITTSLRVLLAVDSPYAAD